MRCRQPGLARQFLAQCARGVGGFVDPALLQHRHHPVGEAFERLRRHGIGAQAQSDLHDISDGLSPDKRPAWERLPEQRTPADFGVDEQGKPLAQNTQSAQDAAWQQYLMPSEKPTAAAHGFQTASLRQQAMRRKRDMRPRFRPQPQLRARKK